MTKPREWGNGARHARDRAAEEVVTALRQAERTLDRVERGEFTRAGVERDLLRLIRHLNTAARHLESVGAPTLPD
ncbi:MAG: hypothetical protein IAE79_17950 [Anaerolinea sp.]|nr:hypothetical protein [Anaerolinea sp.]